VDEERVRVEEEGTMRVPESVEELEIFKAIVRRR